MALPPAAMDNQLRILTFNCWGLKFIAKDLPARINAIADELAATEHDIIGLQELWVYAHYEIIRDKVASRLPYAKFFHSGALGGGLALFSKFPVLQATTFPYALNGTPLDVAGGDWFVGKCAGSILISHPTLGPLEIFTTHLHARGGEEGPEWQRAHRLSNAWQLSKLIKQAAERGRFVILIGDLNSVPGTLPERLLAKNAHLQDAWITTHPGSADDPGFISTPETAVNEWGITCDTPLITYNQGKQFFGYVKNHHGKRLDYVFYRPPANPTSISLQCLSTKVVFTNLPPGKNHSYSDHFGVEAIFAIETAVPPAAQPTSDLDLSTIQRTIEALTTYLPMVQKRNKLHLGLFIGSLVVILAVIIGSAWLPHAWINPIFLLFTVAASWFATTMLYVGFLFGNWEANGLVSLIEELQLLTRG